MYTNSAYWHNKTPDFDDDFEDTTHPLFIISSGTYHLYTRPKLRTYRPQGRLDYQLIYIASGKAYFYFNGTREIIYAGNMILFRPGEEQHYYYCGPDQTEAYWVHFTGSEVKNTLEKYGLTDEMQLIHTGTSPEYKNIFLQMIQELKLCREDYEDLLANRLQHLFILIHRIINSKPQGRNQHLMQEMDSAVRYFHENYNKTINIEEYAVSHHMSVSWFIHSFKEYTDSTPTQYILSLRISNAQTLLRSTDYNITEIASIVGYDNPLYFSRIFRKQNGLSPSDFRKQFREQI